MATRKRKAPLGVDTSAPAWMVTFTDMVMLIMVFFVFLFSFSVVQEVKFKAALGSLRRYLGYLPMNAGAMLGDANPALAAQIAEGSLRDGVPGDEVEVMNIDERQKIVVGGRVLFNEGASDILPDGFPVLRELADPLRAIEFRIEVRGHASVGEAAAGDSEDEWALGYARARAVARYLVEKCDIRADRLRLASAGSVDPASRALFKDDASRDRRVEIVVTGELLRPVKKEKE